MIKCIQCDKDSKVILCDPCFEKLPAEERLIKSLNDITTMLVHYEFRAIQAAGLLGSTEGALLSKVAEVVDAFTTLKSGAANEEMITEIKKTFLQNA